MEEEPPPDEDPLPDEPGLPELAAREDPPPDEGGAEVPVSEEACAEEDETPVEEFMAALLPPLEAVTEEELFTPEDAATLVAVEVPPLDAEEDMARLEDPGMDADVPLEDPRDDDGRLCALDPLAEEETPTTPELPPVDDEEDEDDDDVSAGFPVVHATAEANRKTLDHLAAALKVKRRVTFRSLGGVRDSSRRERNL